MQIVRSSILPCIAALAFLTSGCGDREPDVNGDAVAAEATSAPESPPVISPADIINNPDAWVGRRVTVKGDVEEVWTPRAFNMDSGVTAGELLVVSRESFPTLADHDPLVDDIATVTGTVRILAIAEVERELGWDLQPEVELEFSGKPLLIVDGATFEASSAATDDSTEDRVTDMVVIVRAVDPVALVGRKVHLENVQVQRVVGDRMFAVGPDASQTLLAALAPSLDQPPFEQIVDVTNYRMVSLTGEVRRAPSGGEALQRMNLKTEDAAALQRAKVYLYVTAIEVVRR